MLSTSLEPSKRPDLAYFNLIENKGWGKQQHTTEVPNSHRRKNEIINSLHDAPVAFMAKDNFLTVNH